MEAEVGLLLQRAGKYLKFEVQTMRLIDYQLQPDCNAVLALQSSDQEMLSLQTLN